MHVVLLNQAFHPDVVATAQMGADLARALAARGHRVTAVASRSIYGKSGASLARRETWEGIEIRRVGFSLFGKRGTLARVFDFGMFYVLAAVRTLTLSRPDVVVSFTTPPYIARVGLSARFWRRARAVYWVMDVYPDVMVASGMLRAGSWRARMLTRLHRRILRRSDATVSLGRCMSARLAAHGAPAEKLHQIGVWADLDGITPMARERSPYRARWNLGDAFTVMYSGNFGLGHDAATICDAMRRLKDRGDIRFVFVGDGKRRKEVQAFIAEHGITNASWQEYVPREELGLSLAAADCHLVTVKEGWEGLIVPSKVFGVMASGRPTLFIGPAGSEAALVLSESGGGRVISQGDGAALAEAIVALKEDPAGSAAMGEAARRAAIGRHGRERATAQWVELLESLAPGAQGAKAVPSGAGASAAKS